MSEAKKDPVVYVIVLFLMYVNSPLRAVDWAFQEIIVDDNPPQLSRITDCGIVDINRDGKPDLWFSARKGSHKDEDHFMPWYENTGDMKNWKRHLTFQGPACYGTWGDIDGDSKLDVVVSSEEETDGITWFRNPGENAKGIWTATDIIVPDSGWKGLHSLQLADFDGDGVPDIAGKNYDKDKRPRIWLNQNVGTNI